MLSVFFDTQTFTVACLFVVIWDEGIFNLIYLDGKTTLECSGTGAKADRLLVALRGRSGVRAPAAV